MNGDPDPQEPRTGGVRVYRTSLAPECDGYGYFEGDGSEFPNTPAEPGTWFPLAEAEALIELEKAARAWSEGTGESDVAEEQAIDRALDVLAALRSKPPERPDNTGPMAGHGQ